MNLWKYNFRVEFHLEGVYGGEFCDFVGPKEPDEVENSWIITELRDEAEFQFACHMERLLKQLNAVGLERPGWGVKDVIYLGYERLG